MPFGPIVACLDGSELGERIIPHALAMARALGAPLTLLRVGRGGWSWYTGSAAWAWRFGVEQILGLRLHDGALIIDPCLPPGWEGFEAEIRGPAGILDIRVEDPERVGRGVIEVRVDGERCEGFVTFPKDGSTHRVRVRLGSPG